MNGGRSQGLRYLLVGGANTVFGFGTFAALQLTLGDTLGYLTVLVIAWIVNVLEAFFAYRLLVFRVHGQVLRDLARFTSVYAGAFAFNLIALPVGVDGLGLPVLVAQGAVLVLTVVSSFFLHRNFSFKRATPTAGPR